jgi:hypothetical protein
MRRAPLSIIAVVCAAGLGACAGTESTAPSSRGSRVDATDAAPFLWPARATPGTLREAVLAWNGITDAFFQPPIFDGQSPPADARGYAMANVAVHDALNAIDRRYAPYAYTGTVSRPVSGEAAIASAVHGVLASLGSSFATPGPVAFVDEEYQKALAAIPDGAEKTAGVALGESVAAAVLASRVNDGSDAPFILPFTSAGTPGAFRPLAPDPSATAISGVAPLQQWGSQRPFVVGSVAPFLARAPYGTATLAEAVQTPQYLTDYAETRALGGVVSQRTQDQTDIGYFWIESPARGWNEVARAILSQRQETAWRTARLLAQVHLAMADAFIANFDSKYHWKFWRPVTAIRLGNMDPSTPGDPTWDAASSATELGGTPPMPEWPSAHAMAGAAAAEVLKREIPGTTRFTMTTATALHGPRHYASVDDAARDNNLSRIYVGYHWRSATVEGERLGRLVGRYVAEHALQPRPSGY